MRTSVLRRRTGATALALAGAVTLSGCVDSGRTSNPDSGQESACPVEVNEEITTEARIAYQQIPNGDLVVRDNGWLEACMPNATITWTNANSGGDVIQQFGSDSVDLGLVGSSPATKAVSAPLNIDIQVVWIHDVIGDAESLIALGDASSIEDLAGKRIAVPFASTAHYSLLSALDEAGMDSTQDVSLINLAPDAMLAAWEREEIDAAWVWDPTLTELKETGSVLLSSEDTAEAGTPTYDLGAAQTGFIEDNPEFMLMWTRLQDHAVQQIQDDPQQAADAIAVQLGNDADQVMTQLEGYTYLTASEQAGEDYFGGQLGADLLATAEFLQTQQEVDQVSPAEVYEGAVYADAITEVGR